MLERIWRASAGLSGKLLVPGLPAFRGARERHHGLRLSPAVRRALTTASAATLDRRLQPLRQRRARQPRRVAPAAATVRDQVPVRTWGEWAAVPPGARQGDLVLHCGDTADGLYLTTLVAVDVATTWTELEAVWGTGHRRVGTGRHRIRTRLPFALRAWHSDNGSEFINAHLVTWCRHERVHFPRGRPYRKNDQAWVEQRNGLAVRRLVGYDRYSRRVAAPPSRSGSGSTACSACSSTSFGPCASC